LHGAAYSQIHSVDIHIRPRASAALAVVSFPPKVIVIDEASMLDLKTAYRIFQTLPDNVRIVLVGDPYQLPPIGAGLVFHKLVVTQSVPKVSLTEVKRQDRSTGIAPAWMHRASTPPLRYPWEHMGFGQYLAGFIQTVIYKRDIVSRQSKMPNHIASGNVWDVIRCSEFIMRAFAGSSLPAPP
jgi:hypothetical protein